MGRLLTFTFGMAVQLWMRLLMPLPIFFSPFRLFLAHSVREGFCRCTTQSEHDVLLSGSARHSAHTPFVRAH